jgi:hypothetical protein
MSTKEIILHELEEVPEQDFEAVLRFIRSLKSRNAEESAPALLAESSVAKDWPSPEEVAAWTDL